MVYCFVSCQLLMAQSGFHKILLDVNQNFLQSAIAFLKPMPTTFAKSELSSNYDDANKNYGVEKFHSPVGGMLDVNKVLQLSAGSFKNEKFITTRFSMPVNLTSKWKLTLTMNDDWTIVKANANETFRIHMYDYNIHATQAFRLSKDFFLKLTGCYSSIGFLPPH